MNLLFMVIVYTSKRINNLNAQTASNCVFTPQIILLIYPYGSSIQRVTFLFILLTNLTWFLHF
jgi:hypothetical protein